MLPGDQTAGPSEGGEPPEDDLEGGDDLLPEDGHERSLVSRTGLVALSLVLFVIGVLLWPVPVASGIPFHVAGIVTLGMASPRVARLVNRLERRLPDGIRRGLRRFVRAARARFSASSEAVGDADS